MTRETTRSKLMIAVAVMSLTLLALLSACSGDGDVTVPTSGDGGGTETTQAPSGDHAMDSIPPVWVPFAKRRPVHRSTPPLPTRKSCG